jgi:hypothetical protein
MSYSLLKGPFFAVILEEPVVDNCRDMRGGSRDLGVGKLEVLFSIITGKFTLVFNIVAGLKTV